MEWYYKLLIILLVFSFIVPQVAFASWWNPFSWNIWNKIAQIFSRVDIQEQTTASLENSIKEPEISDTENNQPETQKDAEQPVQVEVQPKTQTTQQAPAETPQIVQNTTKVQGCTDKNASNYNAQAEVDDRSCVAWPELKISCSGEFVWYADEFLWTVSTTGGNGIYKYAFLPPNKKCGIISPLDGTGSVENPCEFQDSNEFANPISDYVLKVYPFTQTLTLSDMDIATSMDVYVKSGNTIKKAVCGFNASEDAMANYHQSQYIQERQKQESAEIMSKLQELKIDYTLNVVSNNFKGYRIERIGEVGVYEFFENGGSEVEGLRAILAYYRENQENLKQKCSEIEKYIGLDGSVLSRSSTDHYKYTGTWENNTCVLKCADKKIHQYKEWCTLYECGKRTPVECPPTS